MLRYVVTVRLCRVPQSQIPGPLNDEIEQAEAEKKRQQRKMKRIKEKFRRKEFELKKQEENEKQRFLNLQDVEKVRIVIYEYTCKIIRFKNIIDSSRLSLDEFKHIIISDCS